MSRDHQDGDHIDLHCTLGELRVTISAPKAQATDLLLSITSRREGRVLPRTEEPESRTDIAVSFPDCPLSHLALGSRLSGSSTSGEERTRRDAATPAVQPPPAPRPDGSEPQALAVSEHLKTSDLKTPKTMPKASFDMADMAIIMSKALKSRPKKENRANSRTRTKLR